MTQNSEEDGDVRETPNALGLLGGQSSDNLLGVGKNTMEAASVRVASIFMGEPVEVLIPPELASLGSLFFGWGNCAWLPWLPIYDWAGRLA